MYMPIFNGRRIVLLKTGPGMDAAAFVREQLVPIGDFEIVHVDNHPKLHETAGFMQGLELLASTDPNEATFYAHTKGVAKWNRSRDHQLSIMQWRNRMYHECLHDPVRVRSVLEHAACAGCYRRAAVDYAGHPWCFAGSFFWFRHDRVFSDPDWPLAIVPNRMGPELFLSGVLDVTESAEFYGTDGILYGDVFNRYACERCGFERQTRYCPMACKRCNGRLQLVGPSSMYGEPERTGPTRLDVINRLATVLDARTYLEVGVHRGETFARVQVPRRESVDPNHPATHAMRSDAFFETVAQGRKWDLIFIDGYHTRQQARRDIGNALEHLEPGGAIVVHDCNPTTRQMQMVPAVQSEWTGDVWKAWVQLRQTHPGLDMVVVDTDYGCGVIRRGRQQLLGPHRPLTYNLLDRKRRELLNLQPWSAWVASLSSVQPRVGVVA